MSFLLSRVLVDDPHTVREPGDNPLSGFSVDVA
jgi:hypothetical protein